MKKLTICFTLVLCVMVSGVTKVYGEAIRVTGKSGTLKDAFNKYRDQARTSGKLISVPKEPSNRLIRMPKEPSNNLMLMPKETTGTLINAFDR